MDVPYLTYRAIWAWLRPRWKTLPHNNQPELVACGQFFYQHDFRGGKTGTYKHSRGAKGTRHEDRGEHNSLPWGGAKDKRRILTIGVHRVGTDRRTGLRRHEYTIIHTSAVPVTWLSTRITLSSVFAYLLSFRLPLLDPNQWDTHVNMTFVLESPIAARTRRSVCN